VNQPYGSIPPELAEFLEACRADETQFDDRIDRLLVAIAPGELAAGLSHVLEQGTSEDWPVALQLVGILGADHPELWRKVIDTIELREDFGFAERMEGVALLMQANLLPDSGRCAELAEEWGEITGEEGDEIETLIHLLQEDPDDAKSWLGEIADWTSAEREQLLDQLKSKPRSSGRDTLVSWLESCGTEIDEISADSPDGLSHEAESAIEADSIVPAWELARTEVASLWSTDLAFDGTFGAGLETGESRSRRFVVAGSLTTGIRYAASFETAAGESFEPDLPAGRLISYHPSYVRQSMRLLLRAGASEAIQPETIDQIREAVLDEFAPHAQADANAWERWTRTLIDTNPLDRRPVALTADSKETLGCLDHWLVVDAEAVELASEFRAGIDHVPIERLRAAMRVWFERSLGPKLAMILVGLREMGYFWVSLDDLDGENSGRWNAIARASARIVADLSDPSRVVATHPFIETWMRLVFEKALNIR
jgi:hypothetical protein